MSRHWRRLITGPAVLLLGASLLTGCSSVKAYLANLGDDAMDCTRLSAGYGLGLHARADVLPVPVGLGYAWSARAGLDGPAGAQRFAWRDADLTLTLPPFCWMDVQGRGLDPGAPADPLDLASDVELRADAVRNFGVVVVDRNKEEESDLPRERSAFSVRTREPVSGGTRLADYAWAGGGATLLVVSAEAGVNPLETLDFLAAFVAADLLGDNRH